MKARGIFGGKAVIPCQFVIEVQCLRNLTSLVPGEKVGLTWARKSASGKLSPTTVDGDHRAAFNQTIEIETSLRRTKEGIPCVGCGVGVDGLVMLEVPGVRVSCIHPTTCRIGTSRQYVCRSFHSKAYTFCAGVTCFVTKDREKGVHAGLKSGEFCRRLRVTREEVGPQT